MSLKKFPGHLKSGWRPNNTNDTDDSDCSSDSDSTVQYIHNFLSSRAKSSDSSPTHKNWQYSAVGLPPALSCEHPHQPFLPTKPGNTNGMAVNSAAGNNYHLMHHDYAERMNEQLTRDTFNNDAGDLLDFGVRADLPRSTVPDIVNENGSSNSVNPPEMGPYEIPVAAPLNLGKCPIKKRPWFMTTDKGSKESGKTESTSNYDGSCSSRSGSSDLLSPKLPQWSTYRSSLAPPLLSDVISAAAVSSSVPSTEVPSSSSQRDRLKLRLKRINLSEASSSSYTPYTCTLSHSVRGGVGNNMWPRAREKSPLFPLLSPDSRVQPSTSQTDPAIDDNSPEIQFISMEQPSSAHSLLMSRVSAERMKRRKRRRMHLGMLGKTYVSDEVIVVDDGHQEQDGRSSQLTYKASVPGPSSRRKVNSVALTSAKPDTSTPAPIVVPPHSSSTVTENVVAPDGNIEMQSGNVAQDNNVEIPVERELLDGSVANPERSATPDSVVAITPTRETPARGEAMLTDDVAMPADGTAMPVTNTTLDRDARTPTVIAHSSLTVPVQMVPTLLSTTLSLAFGSSSGMPTSQGSSEAEGVQSQPSMSVSLTSGSSARNPVSQCSSGEEAVQPMVLDTVKSRSVASEVKDMEVADPQQHNDKQTEGKPTIRVKDMLKNEAMFTDTVNRLKSKLMSLTAILECPVCLEYVGPPIYQCRRGHIVCGLCKPKLMYCPTCRSGFSEYRNLIAEMFAERLDYPCKNAHLGCESTFTLKDKEDHEANCSFRFYKCILCPWKGLHGELLSHLMRDHPGKVGHGAEQEILLELGDMTASANQNWIVSAMNEIFRVNFILAKRQNNMQIMGSVQFIGPRRRADDFIYTFEVKSEEFDQHCIFSRKTHSDLDKCYTYYTNGDGFFINNSVLFSSGEEGNKCILVKLILKKKNNV